MVSIKKNAIVMTRGDTLRTHIEILDANGDQYIPTEEDVIRFALKKHYNDENVLIYKEIPYDTMELHIEPEDTKSLEQPSDYVYDIQIVLNNGDVITFISSTLELTEEVE